MGFDSECCGCVLRATYCLLCACQLAQYDLMMSPLSNIHIMWTRLSFLTISSNESQAELVMHWKRTRSSSQSFQRSWYCWKSDNQTKVTWNFLSYYDINDTSNI